PGCVEPGARLGAIPGAVPSLTGEIRGCAFATRCEHAREACRTAAPPRREAGAGRAYRCVMAEDEATVAGSGVGGGPRSGVSGRTADESAPLLSATGVHCRFSVRKGLFGRKRQLNAVNGVSLAISCGETVAVVGESGCGKTTLARVLLGLI